MEKFRSLRKRSWTEGPERDGAWTAVLDAQTSLEQTRAANKRLQEDGALRSQPVAGPRCHPILGGRGDQGDGEQGTEEGAEGKLVRFKSIASHIREDENVWWVPAEEERPAPPLRLGQICGGAGGG